jgi:PAS domain S-box-containing protein
LIHSNFSWIAKLDDDESLPADSQDTEVALMPDQDAISLQALIDILPAPVFYKDAQGRYLGCNTAFEVYLGLSRDRIVGRTAHEISPPELADNYHQKDLELFRNPGLQVYETSVRRMDGTIRNVIFNKATFQGDDGAVGGLVGVITDITERKRSEEALHTGRMFLEKILNVIPQTIFWKDQESVYQGCNELFAKRAGLLSAAQIVGKTDFDLPWLHEEAVSYRADDRTVLESGEPKLHFIETQVQADGRQIWVDTSKLPIVDGEGRIYGVLGVYDDITERRLAEKRLDEELEVRRKLVAAAPIGVALYHGVSGRCELSNAALASIVGGTAEQVLGQNFRELPSWKRAGMLEVAERALSTGEDQRLETYIETMFGKCIWASCVFSTFLIGGEQHLLMLLSDITEGHQAREALRQSEAQYRMLAEKMGEGLIATDTEGRYTYCNPRFLQMLGYEPDGLLGKTFFETAFHYDYEDFRRRLQNRQAGSSEQYEIRLHHKDGSPVDVLVSAEPLFGEQGEFTGTLGIITDIRERKRSEEALRRAHKVESLMMLAGGVAHDFNNLFQTIQGNLEMAKELLVDPERARRALERALQSLEKANVLSQRMLDYSGKGSSQSLPIDLSELVRLHSTLFSNLTGPDTEIKYRVPSGLPSIEGDPEQLLQVLNALITNANESLEGAKGTIIIALEEWPEDLPPEGVWVEPPPAAQALVLSVSDNGRGMTPETIGKLFDPFFTTKEPGRGLGLASALGILKGHQAGLQLQSTSGKGTLIRLAFPVRLARPELETPLSTSAIVALRDGFVLLVDDDPGVRSTGAEILKDFLNYQVLTARDGREAVDVFTRHADTISVILMDATMPNMTGSEAYQVIKTIRPGAKAILCSGYSDETGNKLVKEHGFQGFLKKPYSIKELQDALEKATRT